MIYLDLGPEDMTREPTHLSSREKTTNWKSYGSMEKVVVYGKRAHAGSFNLNKTGAQKLFKAIEGNTIVDGVYNDQVPLLVIRFTWRNQENKLLQRFVIGAELLNDGVGVSVDDVEDKDIQYIALEQNRKWELV